MGHGTRNVPPHVPWSRSALCHHRGTVPLSDPGPGGPPRRVGGRGQLSIPAPGYFPCCPRNSNRGFQWQRLEKISIGVQGRGLSFDLGITEQKQEQGPWAGKHGPRAGRETGASGAVIHVFLPRKLCVDCIHCVGDSLVASAPPQCLILGQAGGFCPKCAVLLWLLSAAAGWVQAWPSWRQPQGVGARDQKGQHSRRGLSLWPLYVTGVTWFISELLQLH